MKKWIILLSAGLLVSFAMVGCGSTDDTGSNAVNTTPSPANTGMDNTAPGAANAANSG